MKRIVQLTAVVCAAVLIMGCNGNGAVELGDDEQERLPEVNVSEGTVEFALVSVEELPKPVWDLVYEAVMGGVQYGDEVYVLAKDQRVTGVTLAVLDSGAREIRVIVEPADATVAARFVVSEADLWLPVVVCREDGTVIGKKKLVEAHDLGPRAGNKVYVRLFIPDPEIGLLIPVLTTIHTRPAPIITRQLFEELLVLGILTRQPVTSSLQWGEDVITIDLGEDLALAEDDPLLERLVIESIVGTVLELHGLSSGVRFLVRGEPSRGITGTIDFSQPLRFPDVWVDYGRMGTEELAAATAELLELLGEQRERQFDGAHAEDYAARLGEAFRENPGVFVRGMSELSREEMVVISQFTAYNCGYFDRGECVDMVVRLRRMYALERSEMLACSMLLAALSAGDSCSCCP